MSSQAGNRTGTYKETIERLRLEISRHVALLRTNELWSELSRDYRALLEIEELAGLPKTKLEDLLDLGYKNVTGKHLAEKDDTNKVRTRNDRTEPAVADRNQNEADATAIHTQSASGRAHELALGDQQESEATAEIEKGA
jgi:hypothetical protein